MKITYGGEILSRDYFRTWYSCMNAICANNEESSLYEKCGDAVEWLTKAATISKECKDLGLEDKIYPAFGLNGSSYQLYENAAKQIAEWARIYSNLKYPDIYGQFSFEDFNMGLSVIDKTVKNKAEKARFALTRILDKVDVLKTQAMKRELLLNPPADNQNYKPSLECAVA